MTHPSFRALLEESQHQGFIGPASLDLHVAHAEGFALVVEAVGPIPDRAVDLGSGGGLPALVLAARWPESRWWLVEAQERRARFLGRAVVELGWEGRVEVRHDRAEALAQMESARGWADVVTARGFGPPAVTAECAAGYLRVGGVLVVSEPPAEEQPGLSRWSAEGLAVLGLALDPAGGTVAPGGHFQVLHQRVPCPVAYPRRVGVPGKRPLF